MTVHFQPAQLADLDEIMVIENSGFTADEAASRDSMRERIEQISDTFVVAKNNAEAVLGYIVGPADQQRYIADELFETTTPNQAGDRYQTVLSLAVSPDYQKQGIAGQLLTELARIARAQNRDAITLTCLERLVPFYEKNGYQNEGVSASAHAGETWYNMVLLLTAAK